MSAFKDAVNADINNVFINALEFAEPHNINGKLINCVVDDDILEERLSRTNQEYFDGVFKHRRLVFVEANELPHVPVVGELFRLDGKRYTVANVAENMGVLDITIESNDQ